MDFKAQYVAKQIVNISIADRYVIAKWLLHKNLDLKQTNNGAVIHLIDIDDDTMNDIYELINSKLTPE